MMASRGMGAIAPAKRPKGVRKQRRDDTSFTQYAEGGSTSRVNEAGKQFVKQPKGIAQKTARFR